MFGSRLFAAGLLAISVLTTGCANRPTTAYNQTGGGYGDTPAAGKASDTSTMVLNHDAVTLTKKCPRWSASMKNSVMTL
jgi:hypothetical protein